MTGRIRLLDKEVKRVDISSPPIFIQHRLIESIICIPEFHHGSCLFDTVTLSNKHHWCPVKRKQGKNPTTIRCTM